MEIELTEKLKECLLLLEEKGYEVEVKDKALMSNIEIDFPYLVIRRYRFPLFIAEKGLELHLKSVLNVTKYIGNKKGYFTIAAVEDKTLEFAKEIFSNPKVRIEVASFIDAHILDMVQYFELGKKQNEKSTILFQNIREIVQLSNRISLFLYESGLNKKSKGFGT